MRAAPAVLHVAPHPDDELLGAPATLMALRDAGWRVVNLGCSLGRPADSERRRAELAEACARARFELVIPEELPPIGEADDLALAQASLARQIGQSMTATGAALIFGPSRHDGHHGHAVVGRALLEAVETRKEPSQVMFWAVWRDLPRVNVLTPFDTDRIAEIQHALAAHAGELARNRFDRLLEGRALASAVLGPERIFGHGSPGIPEPYAELLLHASWSATEGWRVGPSRVFDASDPLAERGPSRLAAIDSPGVQRRGTI